MNTKTTFQPRTMALLVIALLAAGLFSGCLGSMDGKIVCDQDGNFYQLSGQKVMGDNAYRLMPIDTTKMIPIGFSPCR